MKSAVKPQRLDLNLFRVFDAIYTQGSLTHAAESLHITQSAVSNALARLRQYFSDPLFVRGAGGVIPTPQAQNIANDVRRAIELLQQTVEVQQTFIEASTRRRFVLLMGDQMEGIIMPAVTKSIAKRAKGVTFEIRQLQRTNMGRDLFADADFAIDAISFADRQLEQERLFVDDYVCVVRRGHRLIRQGLGLDDYLTAAHIHTSSRRRGAGYVDVALRNMGKTRNIVYRTQHYLDAQYVVAQTDYLLSIPRSVANLFKLPILALPFEVPLQETYLYWHSSTTDEPGSVWLRQIIKQQLGDLTYNNIT